MIMRKEFDDMTVQEKYLKIADDVIAAGNPAKVIKILRERNDD